MSKKFLFSLSSFIDKFLEKNIDNMPMVFIKLIAYYYTNAKIRKIYLKKLGFIMGEGTYSNLFLNFTPNDDFSPSVIIGKNVSIGPNVTFLPNSEPNNSEVLKNIDYVKNNLIKTNTVISVEDDVWLGAGCIIMPNVTIKKGTIVGAGSVVLEDTEEFCTYAGVPAKKIKNYKDLKLQKSKEQCLK